MFDILDSTFYDIKTLLPFLTPKILIAGLLVLSKSWIIQENIKILIQKRFMKRGGKIQAYQIKIVL